MFKCENCGKSSKLNEKKTMRVVKTREVAHPVRYNKNAIMIDPGGRGTQIVKEIAVASCCRKE